MTIPETTIDLGQLAEWAGDWLSTGQHGLWTYFAACYALALPLVRKALPAIRNHTPDEVAACIIAVATLASAPATAPVMLAWKLISWRVKR